MTLAALRIFRVRPVIGKWEIPATGIHLPLVDRTVCTCTVYSVTVMEWRKVRQGTETGVPFSFWVSCGSSHMPGMSGDFLERWTRRIWPLRRHSTQLISFLTLPLCFRARVLPGEGARRSIVIVWLAPAHHFRSGQTGQRGCRGRHTVAPSSIMA